MPAAVTYHDPESQSLLGVRVAQGIAFSVVTASTLASFSTPLRVACGQAREIHVGVASDVAVTITLRHTACGRRVQVDNTATVIAGGTPAVFKYTSAILDECELVVTNTSGSTATISAYIRAI